MSQIKLIVGLANPGSKYEDTRHNAGEWLINELARMYNVPLKEEAKYFGKVAKINTTQGEVRLLVPTTFMNLSGKAVGALANFYRIKPEEILIVHDELDLPPGVAEGKSLSLVRPKKGIRFPTILESSYQHWMTLFLDRNEKGRGERMERGGIGRVKEGQKGFIF